MSLPLLLALGGCAYKLGTPTVTFADDVATLPMVHPTTDRSRWYVPIDAGDAGEWLVFVDTGYSYTTCDDDFVAALQTGTHGRRRVRGELGSLPTTKARLPPIVLGGHKVEGLVCMVRDLGATSSIADPPEVPVAAVLGIDALRPFRVTLDPAAGEIRLQEPRRADPLPDGPNTVPIRREGGVGTRVQIPIQVEGATTRPILDTGAGNTYLDGRHLGLVADRTEEGVTVRGSGPGGATTVDRAYYDVDSLVLADHELAPLTITQRDGTVGLLGLDVLGRVRLTLDFERGLAQVTPVARPAALPAFTDWRLDGAFGFTLKRPTP